MFGSATESPDDVTSYRAALISPDGAIYLEDAQTEEPFFEPQDGTGSGERIVWRSSEISFLPASGLDNWRLQTWDKASGEVTVPGSAELLNGTADTPAVGGDVVPVCNESHAFFSSCVSEGDGWAHAVAAFDLSKANQMGEVIGMGNYPAAVEGGALWASDQLEAGGGTLYGALSRWDGSSSTEVLTVSSDDGSWGISGVWAAGGHVAVCLSSEAADSGCYVVVWSEDLSHCEALIHAPSPSVVGSRTRGGSCGALARRRRTLRCTRLRSRQELFFAWGARQDTLVPALPPRETPCSFRATTTRARSCSLWASSRCRGTGRLSRVPLLCFAWCCHISRIMLGVDALDR